MCLWCVGFVWRHLSCRGSQSVTNVYTKDHKLLCKLHAFLSSVRCRLPRTDMTQLLVHIPNVCVLVEKKQDRPQEVQLISTLQRWPFSLS